MAGCGYVCPVCEGKSFLESGDTCNFCTSVETKKQEISDEVWMKEVHEGNCCGDRPEENK
jgi:hypothetical protein